MKILVCGGRNYGRVLPRSSPDFERKLAEYEHVQRTLNALACKFSKNYSATDNWLPTDVTIITGGATGADAAASDFAVVHYARLEEYPADWKRHYRAAGPIRNQRMIDEGKPDLVVAFPGGTGTRDMATRAKRAGIEVVEIGGVS